MTTFFDPSYRQSVDSRPIRETSLRDLDLEKAQQHLDTARQKGRYSGEQDLIPFLLQVGGLSYGEPDQDDLYPTLAGMLMFGRNPQWFLRHAVVDIGHFYGTVPRSSEVVHLEKNIGGTISDQIDQVERYLWSNIHHGFRLEDSFQRIEDHEYPRTVLRELTVNALAHRDYILTQQVTRVSLFRDHIEWDNPGCLPDGVTIETIRSAQMPRNSALLMLLYQAGYVEGFGMGWDTVYQTLADEELPPPRLAETPASFIVSVYGRPRTGFMPTEETTAPELTEYQEHLYRLIVARGSVGSLDASQLFPDRSLRTVQRDLQVLVDVGLVTTTGAARTLRYHPAT
jgi:ATP-dependent DNA helicase RecG